MAKASIDISFGMIFSIIIIIAIIGVAVYAVTTFLDFSGNAQTGLFYKQLQDTVNEIWSSAETNRVVSLTISDSIEFVCFGSIAGSYTGRYVAQFQTLRTASSGFEQENSNAFLYPPKKADKLAFKKIDKLDTSPLGNFDCFEVRNGKINVRLSKGEFDSLVKIQHE